MRTFYGTEYSWAILEQASWATGRIEKRLDRSIAPETP
jgi:hypothetical protein